MKITEGEFAGWEVFITTRNGERLAEHCVTKDPKKEDTTRVFLEYENDQEFEICVTKPDITRGQEACIYYAVDGRSLGNLLFRDWKYIVTLSDTYEKKDGELWAKPLRFDPLTRVEKGHTVDKRLEKKLGTISVELYAGTIGKDLNMGLPHATAPPRSTLNAMIKPGRLESYVGGQTSRLARETQYWRWTNAANARPCKVVFHYYTTMMLWDMGVIPLPNTNIYKSISENTEPAISEKRKSEDNASIFKVVLGKFKKSAAEEDDSTTDASSNIDSIDEEKRAYASTTALVKKRASIFSFLSCTRQSHAFNLEEKAA